MTDSLHTDLVALVDRLRSEFEESLVTVCLFGSQVDEYWDLAPDWRPGDEVIL